MAGSCVRPAVSNAPYRSDLDALRDRKASLESELSRLTAETEGLDALRARQAQLAKELAQIEGRLGARRVLPMVDQVKVASPCNADWNEMMGDDRVRFCLSCEKNVYNLSAMPREDAEALLQARMPGGEVCVRFYQRPDGTVMTQDCPVGAKKKRRKLLAIAVASAGAMAATALTALSGRKCDSFGGDGPVVMGTMPAPSYVPSAEPTVPPVAPVETTVAPPLNPEPPTHTMGVVAPMPRPHLMGKPMPIPQGKH